MIIVDSHEAPEIDWLLGQSVEVQRSLINQVPGRDTEVFPDFLVINGGKVVGVNSKQVGEVTGNLEALELQLLKELQGPIDSLVLSVRGYITPDVEGNGYWSWNLTEKRGHRSHHTKMSYRALMGFYNRLEMVGIPVWEPPSLYGFALRLLSLHNSLDKEDFQHRLFQRLIKEDYYISETELPRRGFMLSLMGLYSTEGKPAGIGEELADALYSWVEEMSPGGVTLGRLLELLSIDSPAKWPLRSGKRVIGPAAEARLRGALGL